MQSPGADLETLLGPRLALPSRSTLAALLACEAGRRLTDRLPEPPQDDDAAEYVALLQAVDGYAHAIDVIAARCALLTPTQIRARCLRQDMLGLQLDPWWATVPDAEAASTLAVCEPGFDFDIAEFLLGKDALDRVSALLASPWLERDGKGFRMPGPLRAWAAQQVDDETWLHLRDQHAAWQVARTTRRRSEVHAGGPRTHDTPGNRRNLLAAVDHGLSQGGTAELVHLAIGLMSDHHLPSRSELDLANRALRALRDSVDDESRLALRLGRGRLMHLMGMSGWQVDAEQVLEEAEQKGLAHLVERSLGALAAYHAQEGRLDEAEALLARLEALPTRTSVRVLPRTHLVTGLFANNDGQYDRARTHLERALILARQLGAQDLEGDALVNLGTIEADLGLESAARTLAEAVSVLETLGKTEGAIVARMVLGLHRLDRGASAAEMLEQIAGLPGGERDVLVPTRDGVAGLVAMAAGDLHRAEGLLADVVLARLPTEHAHYVPVYRMALHACRRMLGKPDPEPDQDHPRGLADAVRVYAAVAELADALADTRAGRTTTVDAEALRSALPPARSLESRVAMQAWQQTWRQLAEARTTHASDAETLVIATDGSWFRPPGEDVVDLSSKKLLGRLLLELVQARRADTPLTPEQLIAAGWPGERILARAAKNRLRVALTSLRSLGMRPCLLTIEGRYLLDPDVPIVVTDTPPA